MNYSEIKYMDIANGIGVRTTLFVSGCRRHCRNCFNAGTWPFESGRPFTEAVEKEIKRVLKVLKHPYLAWMFENCYPNTIDTTVHFFGDEGSGDDDTYVITGDINAMWLRDSSAQVYPYLQLAKKDKRLQRMLRGVIRRQTRYLLQDPYANAFYGHGGKAEHADDNTEMKPGVFERKYELDSLCYPLFLAYAYLQATGDLSVFDATWVEAV